MMDMIKKVVKIKKREDDEIKDNLEYWLSKTPEERLSAVEHLRRQQDGNQERLQRVLRVTQRAKG